MQQQHLGQGGVGRGMASRKQNSLIGDPAFNHHPAHGGRYDSDRDGGVMSEPENANNSLRVIRRQGGSQGQDAAGYRDIGRTSTGNNQFYAKAVSSGSAGAQAGGQGTLRRGASRGANQPQLYLDFNQRGSRGQAAAGHLQAPAGPQGGSSPPSDSGGIFDSHCFATTPSSSNGNSDMEGVNDEGNNSPTSQLLMDYEEHLRNTLEKGMDAESYSLHTFEALLTRSMENLGRTKLCA